MCAVWRGASMGRQGSVIPTIEDLSDPGRIVTSTASAPLRHAQAGVGGTTGGGKTCPSSRGVTRSGPAPGPIFDLLVHHGRRGIAEKSIIQVALAVGAFLGWREHHVATMLAVEGSASEGVCGPEACELAVFETVALLCLNGLAMSVTADKVQDVLCGAPKSERVGVHTVAEGQPAKKSG